MFEKPTEAPNITSEEYKRLFSEGLDEGNEELMQWMEQNHIVFDQGEIMTTKTGIDRHVVDVNIDGELKKLVTDREDFGTVLSEVSSQEDGEEEELAA